jgi:hypothetical protein
MKHKCHTRHNRAIAKKLRNASWVSLENAQRYLRRRSRRWSGVLDMAELFGRQAALVFDLAEYRYEQSTGASRNDVGNNAEGGCSCL